MYLMIYYKVCESYVNYVEMKLKQRDAENGYYFAN